MTDQQDDSNPKYAALTERAISFVIERRGVVHEDLLVRHVFGNLGSIEMWRPLLRSVLEVDARVVFRADGSWALRSSDPAELPTVLLDEFVAIDVETTGLRPRDQRVIDVALIRYRGGQEVERFESLVNPDRAIPIYIAQLTGISNEHVVDAPHFREIAPRVSEFLDGALLVGHNIAFDISFLNAELGRVDQPILVNERLDTMGLARKLLRGLRKASLDRVAQHVGLEPRKIHRAGRDARLTAEVAIRLVAEAMQQGVTSLDQLKVASTVTERRPRDDVGRGRAVMDKAWLKEIPRKPGVYLMVDQFGNIIYVGKAKSLRERVSSYYSQPLGYTRKMDGLLESMVDIRTIVVGTEIEALLLEAQLIRRYQPRYNTAMRSFEHYPFIKVDVANPWPRISLAKARKEDGALYFGPYRSSSAARRTVEVINSVLPLRTCMRSFKNARSYGHPCIMLDMGKCLGPCTGQANRDEYRQIVQDVIQLLDGRDDALIQRFWNELEHSAETLDFERAARLRRDLRSVLGLVEHQQKLRASEEIHNLLLVLPSPDVAERELFLIYRGVIWARFRMPRDSAREGRPVPPFVAEDVVLAERPVTDGEAQAPSVRDTIVPGDLRAVDDLAARLLRSAARHAAQPDVRLDHHTVDEHAILNRWLMQHAGHAAFLTLPDRLDPAAWRHLALRAQALGDDDLVFVDRPAAEEDDTLADDASAQDRILQIGDHARNEPSVAKPGVTRDDTQLPSATVE